MSGDSQHWIRIQPLKNYYMIIIGLIKNKYPTFFH